MNAIETCALVKRFGADAAVDGVGLEVAQGTVLGLLGPNGAGKTTVVRMLATLTTVTSGTARVAGYDVLTQPAAVRRQIGLVGQHPAVDDRLTGRENLYVCARLQRLDRKASRVRAADLLDQFELTDAADRLASGYSGGMRRRLDLATSLITAPRVLFLDEPTVGLDPPSRTGLWSAIRQLVDAGTTVLLTTQYLEEADRLADQIAIIDRGRIVAHDRPDQLKLRVGAEQLVLTVPDERSGAQVAQVIHRVLHTTPQLEPDAVSVALPDGYRDLAKVVATLEREGVDVEDLNVRRPTLDDVFLKLTGSAPASTDPQSEEALA